LKVFICVTGMPGAGKSEVAKRLAEALNAKLLNMGDVVREEAVKRGLSIDRSSLMNLAKSLREELGPSVVAEVLMSKINEDGVYVIDGVRSLHEVRKFNAGGKVLLVAVHASPKTRYCRLSSRGREDDPKNWDEFVERDLKELKLGVGEVIALADVMLVNEGEDLEGLVNRALEVIHKVLANVPVEG